MQKKIPCFISVWLKDSIRSLRRIRYLGNQRFCPVCGTYARRFEAFGRPPRKEAKCIVCGALERHRFVWLYFQKKTDLFDGKEKKMLHVAPESCFEMRLKDKIGPGYTTADLYDPQAMVRMDITDIQFPNDHFDIIYCNHVLEHVEEDRKAMKEFHRVLKQDGWALLIVPITTEKTYEDSSIVTPAERLKAFGQEDHVRLYGLDYIERLQQSGFIVKTSLPADLLEESDLLRMGLTSASGYIFFCTKG